jgi:hypothetical protein
MLNHCQCITTPPSTHSWRAARALLVTASLLAFAACGGGGGSSTPVPTLSGLAATGAALPNAAVQAQCVKGSQINGTTSAGGTFELVLTSAHAAPCLLRATGGTPSVTLYGYASAPGRVNLTPLSDLIVARALGADPATAFAAFDATQDSTLAAGLAAAKTWVQAQTQTLVGSNFSVDPLSGTFAVADANDQVLDALGAKAQTAHKTQPDLHTAAIAGTDLIPAVPAITSIAQNATGSGIFKVTGTTLPLTAVLELTTGGTCQTPTNQTATGFDVECTVTAAGSVLATVKTAASAGTAIGTGSTVTVNKYSQLANASGVAYAKEECVRDNLTGLIWEGKNASGSPTRAGDAAYTNYDTVGQMDGTSPNLTEIGDISNSIGYQASVSASALCGYTNWRLPTYAELSGLVTGTPTGSSLMIDATWFPNTQSDYYWTSTAPSRTDAAYSVDFLWGYRGTFFRSSFYHVRLVR